MVTFATQNVLMDPPFTKLDLLLCRNLLIYFNTDLHKKIIPLFHYALNPGGVLFLGTSETIGGFTDLFLPLDTQARVYRRRASVFTPKAAVEIPNLLPVPAEELRRLGLKAKDESRLPELMEHHLLENFTPSAVLINESGDIIYIHGSTGKYLEPASGKVNYNIFAMAREGLKYELASGVRKAARRRQWSPSRTSLSGRTGGGRRRVRKVQRGLVVGETWVALAHAKTLPGECEHGALVEHVCENCPDGVSAGKWLPGVFTFFRPSAIEYVVKGDESDEQVEALEARGLTLVRVEKLEREVEEI